MGLRTGLGREAPPGAAVTVRESRLAAPRHPQLAPSITPGHADSHAPSAQAGQALPREMSTAGGQGPVQQPLAGLRVPGASQPLAEPWCPAVPFTWLLPSWVGLLCPGVWVFAQRHCAAGDLLGKCRWEQENERQAEPGAVPLGRQRGLPIFGAVDLLTQERGTSQYFRQGPAAEAQGV